MKLKCGPNDVKLWVLRLETPNLDCLFCWALFVNLRPKKPRGSSTGDTTTQKRSFPAIAGWCTLTISRGCVYVCFFSKCFSLHAFIRIKALWVMNEAVCFPPAVLHYRAIVCVIRARAQPKLKPCQVVVMRPRVQVQCVACVACV